MMSTTVTYKGSTIATVNNNTKTLKTAGTYMEGDVILTDVSGGSSPTLISKTITANGTYDPADDNADGYSSVIANVGPIAKKKTGTFTGNGSRSVTVSCDFEPDLVYWYTDPGTSASSGSVAGLIARDMLASSVYRNNSTSNSTNTQIQITGMNTNGSSYNFKATYANSTVTLYCFSTGSRSLFRNNASYSYTFVKWTA